MNQKVRCYRSGPIERDPEGSFHYKNILDDVLRELGIEIIGDTFKFLENKDIPHDNYAEALKRLRNQGRFYDYNQQELLLVQSLRNARKADFMIVRPSAEASGGTTSELARAWLSGVPKFVIAGPRGENLIDNNSTFVIRMLTDSFSLVFKTEKEVVDFIKSHIYVIRGGRRAIREYIQLVKKYQPRANDIEKPTYDESFDGQTVIFLGLLGSGKSDQARQLQDFAGFKYFGSGYELRKLASKMPKLQRSLDQGNLAPEIVVNHLLANFFLKLESFEPAVLDGAPRKLNEAKNLMELLGFLNRKPKVIVLDIDEETARQRTTTRKNCEHCERSFLKLDGDNCPNCGLALEIRKENVDREAVEKILEWNRTEVQPVIDFFENLGLVTHLDGRQDPKALFIKVIAAIKAE